MSANSWTYALQTNFVAQPGKTNDLGRMVLLPFPARRPIAQP
jgi:hypothetical protein